MSDTQNTTSQRYKNQAMLVKLSVAKWSASTTDKRVTEDALTQNQASKEAGVFKKRLISRSDPQFKAIGSAASQLRSYHKNMTLPWDKSGRDMLPAKAFLKYKQKMTELEDAFNMAVNNFVASYQEKLNNSQTMLGNMFQAGDYPAASEIASYYAIEINMEPIPTGEDLRGVGIPQKLLEEEQKRIEEDVTKKVKAAHKSLYHRLEKVAENVIEVLSREEPNFKRSFINQVLETADVLEILDMEGDSKLQETAKKIREVVTSADYETLKEDKEVRDRISKDVEAELDDITRAVDEMA